MQTVNQKFEGFVLYIPLEEVSKYTYNENNIGYYYMQQLKGGVVTDIGNEGIQKIIFDVNGSEDYDAGYVKGFFYEDGKFIGHFYYTTDANLPKESINGTYKQIDGGYEIKGFFYDGGRQQYGYYLKITQALHKEKNISKKIITKPKYSIHSSVQVSKSEAVNEIRFIKKILNKDLLKLIISKAEKKKKVKAKLNYSLYKHIANWSPEPDSVDNLLLAMCVAYSWMPTMMDVYVKDGKELSRLLVPLKELGRIKTIDEFDKQKQKIESSLVLLTKAINNSIVGTSKVLHIFYHNYIPIMDSNVLNGWNIVLKKHYRKYPELQLPSRIPGVTHRQVRTFMKYWRLLMIMKNNTKSKSIRQLEEPFYWIGMKG